MYNLSLSFFPSFFSKITSYEEKNAQEIGSNARLLRVVVAIPLATPLPATGYQPGIALSRSISLGPMETFLLTLSVGGLESLRAWLARRKLVSRRPRRSEADSRYPEATLARISRTCTKQISKFMTANTEEEKQ